MSTDELRQVEVFEGYSDEILERIEELGDILAFPKVAEILRPGEPVELMFVVLEGTIQIFLNVGGRYHLASEITGWVASALPTIPPSP